MNTRKTLITALFTGLIIVGTFIRVPLPPVPITLQTLFVIFAALVGGLQVGLTSFIVYLILGTIGLPIFSSGGGLGALIGPTGGFLFGMLLSTIIAGIFSDISKKKENKLPYFIIGGILATIAIYLIGVPWLKISTNMEWDKTIKVGVLPFLIGDTIKLIIAILLSMKFYNRIHELVIPEEE
ncbi:MAG: biotin transporter BioY [Pleomorphochaeta sp.]